MNNKHVIVTRPIATPTASFNDPGMTKFIEKPTFSIFLAGPRPALEDGSDDWRHDAVKYLEEAVEKILPKYPDIKILVYNPTNLYWDGDDPTCHFKQVDWEQNAMYQSELVVFWIPRDKDHPAFTTNIEIGAYLNKNDINRFIVGMPEWGERNQYIKDRLRMLDKTYENDLKMLMYLVRDRAVAWIN